MIVYIDIETVPQFKTLSDASEEYYILWKKFCSARFGKPSEEMSDTEEYHFKTLYLEKAALFAEWGKVACISMGYWHEREEHDFKKISFCCNDEKEVLYGIVSRIRNQDTLCGHYIKEFDVPFLGRRMVINGFTDGTPQAIRVADKKPWDVQLIDTADLWGMTQRRHNISLDLLCFILGVESPKGDMSGEKVAEAYWAGEFERISKYCEGDVYATAQCHRKIIRGLL